MYTWEYSWLCIFGLHRFCRARWDVMGGEATCNCEKFIKHRYLHTGTFADYTGIRVSVTPKEDKP